MKIIIACILTLALALSLQYFFITQLLDNFSPLNQTASANCRNSTHLMTPKQTIKKIESSTDALTHAFARLEERLNRLDLSSNALNAPQVYAAPSATAQGIELRDDLENSISTQELREDTRDQLEERMLTMEADPDWERRSKDDIDSFFSQYNGDDLQLHDSYCSGSMCRIEFTYADPAQAEAIFSGAKPLVSWPHRGKSFALADNVGRNRQVMYLSATQVN